MKGHRGGLLGTPGQSRGAPTTLGSEKCEGKERSSGLERGVCGEGVGLSPWCPPQGQEPRRSKRYCRRNPQGPSLGTELGVGAALGELEAPRLFPGLSVSPAVCPLAVGEARLGALPLAPRRTDCHSPRPRPLTMSLLSLYASLSCCPSPPDRSSP